MNLYGPKQLADSIRTVRRNVVLIAEDIHEDDYLFRPSVRNRSVAEILIHIAFFSNFDYLFHEEEHVTTVEAFDFGQFLNDGQSQEKMTHTKSKLIELLRESGESWAGWVEFVPEQFLAEGVAQCDGTLKTRFEMILGTKEHEMHHLGQLTVIERNAWYCPSPHASQLGRRGLLTKIGIAIGERNSMKLTDRTILITGGSAGIGLAFARKFLELGNQVIVTGRRQSTLEQLKANYPKLHTIQSDVADPAQIASLAKRVKASYPKLDVLMNNAGIMIHKNLTAPAADLEGLTAELDINLSGVIRMTSAFIDILTANRGTVINVSSGLAFVPLSSAPIYCATKAAVHSYTQSLRFQLEQTGVEVIELMPPAVKTDLSADLPEEGLVALNPGAKRRIRASRFACPGRISSLPFLKATKVCFNT